MNQLNLVIKDTSPARKFFVTQGYIHKATLAQTLILKSSVAYKKIIIHLLLKADN